MKVDFSEALGLQSKLSKFPLCVITSRRVLERLTKKSLMRTGNNFGSSVSKV